MLNVICEYVFLWKESKCFVSNCIEILILSTLFIKPRKNTLIWNHNCNYNNYINTALDILSGILTHTQNR